MTDSDKKSDSDSTIRTAVTVDQMGQKVMVTGHMLDDGSLQVDKVANAS